MRGGCCGEAAEGGFVNSGDNVVAAGGVLRGCACYSDVFPFGFEMAAADLHTCPAGRIIFAG